MSYGKCVSHLEQVLDRKQVRKTVKQLKIGISKSKVQFDTIACRGISGLAIASLIARDLNKQVAVIRTVKSKHRGHTVEVFEVPKKYIIIDDLISSGDTMNEIHASMRRRYYKIQIVHIFLYDKYADDKPRWSFDDKMVTITITSTGKIEPNPKKLFNLCRRFLKEEQ